MRFAPALFPVVVSFFVLACQSAASIDEVHGVRLGMTPAEVRERFALEGAFVVTPEGEGELRLDWQAASASAPVDKARFEFHEGLLVAIRATHGIDSSVSVQRLEVSPWAVRVTRADTQNHMETTLLARGCPTHESEVQELLSLR